MQAATAHGAGMQFGDSAMPAHGLQREVPDGPPGQPSSVDSSRGTPLTLTLYLSGGSGTQPPQVTHYQNGHLDSGSGNSAGMATMIHKVQGNGNRGIQSKNSKYHPRNGGNGKISFGKYFTSKLQNEKGAGGNSENDYSANGNLQNGNGAGSGNSVNHNMPNPCSHPSIQFVAHPTEPHKYYVCKHPHAMEHQCPTGQVWVQPYRKCRSLAEQVGGTPIVRDNPCIGSMQRFQAMPGDPTRYIECSAWFKGHVWNCGLGKLWDQDSQQCVKMELPPLLHADSGPVNGINGAMTGNGAMNGINVMHGTGTMNGIDVMNGAGALSTNDAQHSSGAMASNGFMNYAMKGSKGTFVYVKSVMAGKTARSDNGYMNMVNGNGDGMNGNGAIIGNGPIGGNDIPNNDGAMNGDGGMDVTDGDSTARFCQNSDSFYHPYPQDPSKFIQCDEYGNMYIRKCGPKKSWHDGYKTCVGNNQEDSAGGTNGSGGTDGNGAISHGTHGNGGSGAMNGMAVSTSNVMNGGMNGNGASNGQSGATSGITGGATAGTVADASRTMPTSDLSSPCSSSQYYDAFLGRCVSWSVPATMDFMQVTCPPGFDWVLETGRCVPQTDDAAAEYRRADDPFCAQGFLWDSIIQMCVQAIPIDNMNYASADAHDTSYQDNGGQNDASYSNGEQFSSSDGQHDASVNINGAPSVGFTDNGDQNVADANGAERSVSFNGNGGDEMMPVMILKHEGDNPCESETGFYFPYEQNPNFFIQCDESGRMFIMPCAPGLAWNQDTLTCSNKAAPAANSGRQGSTMVSGNGDLMVDVGLNSPEVQEGSGVSSETAVGGSVMSQDLPANEGPLIASPCSSSNKVYHSTFDSTHFIMCLEGVPYMMTCPTPQVWDPATLTCTHPNVN